MSVKLSAYVWDGCAAAGLKISAVAIMARLADFSSDEGLCWPSITTIARQLGAGESTVRTTLGKLEADGWITSTQRRKGNRNTSNMYQLNIAKLRAAAEPSDSDASKSDASNSDRSKFEASKSNTNTGFHPPESGGDPLVNSKQDPSDNKTSCQPAAQTDAEVEITDQAKQVLNYLNLVTGSRYQVSKSSLDNAEGTIQAVKSIDEKLRAASGTGQNDSKNNKRAGATASKTNSIKGTKMNISEQIKSFETKRATLEATRESVMAKSFEEGRTLDLEEEEKYDEVSAEIKSVDSHLTRLRDMEATKADTAKPVQKAANGHVVTTEGNRAPGIIRVEQKLEKGIAFARFAKSLAAANGSRSEALEIAKKQYPHDAKLHHVLKAAVGAGTTTDPTWAGMRKRRTKG